MKWLIGIAAVMLIAHFFWTRAEKARREGRRHEEPREEDPPAD